MKPYYAAILIGTHSFESVCADLQQFAEQIVRYYTEDGGWVDNSCPEVDSLVKWENGEEVDAAGEVAELDRLIALEWASVMSEVKEG